MNKNFLIKELNKSNSKLQIELSNGIIEASFYNSEGPYDVAVTFIHDKGKISMGINVEEINYNNILTLHRPGNEIFWFLYEKEKGNLSMEIVEEEQYSDDIYAILKVKVIDVEKVKKLLLKHNLPFYFKD